MERKTNKYIVEYMTCDACIKSVEDSALKVRGIEEVNVSLFTNSLEIEINENFDEKELKKQLIALFKNLRKAIIIKKKITK